MTLTGIPSGGTPIGNIHLYEGATRLATVFAGGGCCNPSRVDVTVPVLPVGTHYLYIAYDGDASFEPARSAPQAFAVLSANGFPVDVRATPQQNIYAYGFFDLYAPPGHYEIFRRIGAGQWTRVIANTISPSYTEYSAPANTVYTFRMEAYDGSNHLVASSNTDLAMIVSFTDDPLTSGITVRAQHLLEIVAAANTLRATAGLPPINLGPGLANGQPIRASHITALHNAINEARVALGAAAVTFTDDLTADPVIRARQVQDLREAIR